jgi:ADP-ribose pyrophosphatase YjhB (NUDIX family)
MQKKIAGWTWRKMPRWMRRLLVRATQPSFTVSAGAVVFDQKGQVLLLNHVLRPASGWGVPGGFLQKNEQPQDALKRELCEEAGVEIEDLRLISIRTSKGHVEIIYRCQAKNGAEARAMSSEINEAKWFKLDELPPEMEQGQRRLIIRAREMDEKQ